MPRNEQPKSTLRSRQRITNKTRLRVVVGSIDAETVTIGEEDGRGVLHSTQGVEAEDAAEHHLQEVLNASNKATSSPQKATRPSTADAATQATPATQPSAPEHAFIPTPDAQGVVSNYEELYPQRNFEMSYAILKFSETVEECRKFGLNPKSYTMDERDAAWLEEWNKQARGEGTSSSPTKRSRTKVEQEDEQLEVIDEDWYELCMGLFENFSAQHFPFLHVSQSYPEWSWFEPLFLRPYVPTLFASSLVPEGLPPTSELAVMAKGIYPHWLERKQERKGRSVIPDVNLDESDEGNVYVCFRRRELKPIRKTRRMETTSIDKMNRLKAELKSAEVMCDKIIEREETKMEICGEDSQIWKFRTRMVTITAKFPDLRSADDDKWLVDKEKIKKPKIIVDPLPPLRIPRGSANTPQLLDEYLDLGPPQVHPRARYDDIQSKIEQDVARRKEKNLLGWDDVTDSPLQPSIPSAQRYFRSLNGVKKSEQTEKDVTVHPASSFRHRIGRGGRRYLDRRVSPYPNTSSSPFTSAPLPNRTPAHSTGLGAVFAFGSPSFYPAFNFRMQPWIGFPHVSTPGFPTILGADDKKTEMDDTADLVKKMEERWKFDVDNEESSQRTIIDDFDYRQSQARAMLIRDKEWLYQADVSKAITDPRMNLSAPLQDALNSSSHGDQTVAANQLVTNGVSSATAIGGMQPTTPVRGPNVTAPSIRPPNAPAGLLQSGAPRPSPTQQQVPAILFQQQQQLREKQQAALAAHAAQVQASQAQMHPAQNGTPIQTQATSAQATPAQTPVSVSAQVATPAQTNGSAQSSPSQPTALVQPSPNPSSQALTLGNPMGAPAAQPFAPYSNGINGVSSPPKSMVNGYHQSPHPSPRPPMAGLGADAGIVRVSTPLRNKSTMPLQPSGNMPMNGFNSFNGTQPNPANGYAGLVPAGGMSAGMYHNLKLINQQQQMLVQYQQMQQMQQMQSQITPLQMQQHQQFQQQQQQLAQQQQMQQLHMMHMQQQAANMGNPGLQAQFGDGMQSQQMMNMQPMNPGLHGQNLFSSVGMAPGLNTNSNMNMSMQNMNLQLGPQHMALRLPPSRAQQQVGMPRPAAAMGGDFGMVMANGASPMMQPMQIMGMGVPGNQMAAAMSIPRAPSTPLSLRSNGGNLHPTGGMMMARGQSMGPMQSPMMRPTSAASMHSNMGMPMQGGPSLHNSPANIPQTPHLRQQTVPGS